MSSEKRLPKERVGLTLVELLVVIAIIAVLMALLVPAVQAVRESARVSHCRNNMRQIAMGVIAHDNSIGWLPVRGTFPQGGTGTGDPDLGFQYPQGRTGQWGGWMFSVLPFIEQKNLWELGMGKPAGSAGKIADFQKRCSTAVAVYACPSRTPPNVDTGSPGVRLQAGGRGSPVTAFNAPGNVPRSDYALAAGTNCVWDPPPYGTGGHGNPLDRVDRADGIGNVLMFGDRYLNPRDYNRSINWNAGGWGSGLDWRTEANMNYTPLRDIEPYGYPVNRNAPFGGPHQTLHVAFCDGSIRGISYSIPTLLFTQLCTFNDGIGNQENLDGY